MKRCRLPLTFDCSTDFDSRLIFGGRFRAHLRLAYRPPDTTNDVPLPVFVLGSVALVLVRLLVRLRPVHALRLPVVHGLWRSEHRQNTNF